jgi:hypothetical protein
MRPEPVSLVAGVAIAALGGLLIADQAGALSLDWGWAGAALAAAAGLILMVSGLVGQGPEKSHD